MRVEAGISRVGGERLHDQNYSIFHLSRSLLQLRSGEGGISYIVLLRQSFQRFPAPKSGKPSAPACVVRNRENERLEWPCYVTEIKKSNG